MDKQIRHFLTKLRGWLFLRKLVNYMLWALPIGGLVAAIFEMIGYFVPWYWVNYWALGALLLSQVLALVAALVTYPKLLEAARALDGTGLKERCVTALELMDKEGSFAEVQKQDALEKMSQEKYTKTLPIRTGWRRWAASAALTAVALIFAFLPSFAKDLAKSNYELAQEIKKEVKKTEESEKELAQSKELTQEQKEEYQELLESIKKELAEADSKEALEKAQERAQTKLAEKSQEIKSQNAKNVSNQLAELEEDAKDGDLSELSQEERSQLAKELDELAQDEESGLSESQKSDLTEAASAIEGGSLTSDQLASAQASVSAISSEASGKLASSENKSGSSSKQSGDGQNGEDSSESGSGQGSGSGSGSGSGQGSGSGSGSGNGQGSGSGSGSGSGNGKGGGGNGGGWNYGSKNGLEKDENYNGEMLSIPNETGDDSNLTGQTSGDQTYTTKGGDALTWSGNMVKYSQVYGQYKKKAMSKLSKSSYPAGVQDIIKNYFDKISD